MPIKVECWCESDCCWVEVNLVTLTCCGFYQILDIGVSLLAIDVSIMMMWVTMNVIDEALNLISPQQLQLARTVCPNRKNVVVKVFFTGNLPLFTSNHKLMDVTVL